MMSWTDTLLTSIERAIKADGKTRIAVHSEAQADLGRRAVSRMMPAKLEDITFQILSERKKAIYPVGAILVP